MQKKNGSNYDEVITSSIFAIDVKCNHCGSTDCFIGINEHDGVTIDIVCSVCGQIEAYY